jgi:hypothetical protein
LQQSKLQIRDTKAHGFLTATVTLWKRSDRKMKWKGWLKWRKVVQFKRSLQSKFNSLHCSKLRRDKRSLFRVAMRKWMDKVDNTFYLIYKSHTP